MRGTDHKPKHLLERGLRHWPVLLAMCLIFPAWLAYQQLKEFFQKPPQHKKVLQQITMIQAPPPPPPEQKIVEQQVREEEKIEEQAPIPQQPMQPVQTANEQSPADSLDGAGDSGPQGWNMQAGEVRIGGGGAGGNQVLWYGGQIQRRLEDGLHALLADSAAMKTDYSVLIDVWVDAGGSVSRAELVSLSGQTDVDKILSAALEQFKADIGPPPLNLPQPVRIRFTARI